MPEGRFNTFQRKELLNALHCRWIKERSVDIDGLPEQVFDCKGVKTALELAAAFDHDLGHLFSQLAGLVVDHPSARAVTGQVQPVDMPLNENAGAGDFNLAAGIPGKVVT